VSPSNRPLEPPISTSACERCGRTVPSETGCPRHPGLRLLDLRRPEDRAWRDSIVGLRQRRLLRMGTAMLGGVAMVGGFVALTRLISNGSAAHITGDVGMSYVLGVALRLLSEGLVFGGLLWAVVTFFRSLTQARRSLDSIDRNAALRRMSQAVTVAVGVGIYALCLVVLSQKLVGVPPELVAAAAAMVVSAPLQSLVENSVQHATFTPEPQVLLPPEPEGTPVDSRADDPLERVRRNALRQSMMQRR